MQRSDAMQFIDEQMQTRWPDWKPTPEQVADWAVWLGPYDFETARNAVREHIGGSLFNKQPNALKLRALLAKFQPKQENISEQPEPTVFVMYEGGGRGPMLAGYYFPIIVRSNDNVMKAAENMRAGHERRVGGEWKVYSGATYQQMNDMRDTFHKRRVNV